MFLNTKNYALPLFLTLILQILFIPSVFPNDLRFDDQPEARYRLGTVRVTLDGIGSVWQIRNALDFRSGMEVTDSDIRNALREIQAKGRFSSVEYQLNPDKNGRTDLSIQVVVDPGFLPEAGQRLRIDRVEITGNWKTGDSIIRSELLFREGDDVSTDLLEDSIQRILNLNYFYEIDWGLYRDSEHTVMEIRVQERWTTFPVIYFSIDDSRTHLMFGAFDSNLAGLGFALMATYSGYFYYNDLILHNFLATYSHSRIGGTPVAVAAEGGVENRYSYVSDSRSRIRTDAFSFRSIYGLANVSWTMDNGTEFSLSGGYSNDHHESRLPKDEGFSGRDFVENMVTIGGGIGFKQVDRYDQRRDGFQADFDLTGRIPLSGHEQISFNAAGELKFFKVFAADWLHLSSRLSLDYSSASSPEYQIHRGYYLRGGDSKEYFSPFVFGGSIEFGVAPVRENWLFMELVGIFDIAWGGSDFSDTFNQVPMLRAGPGIRLSWPPLAGMFFSLDYVWNEKGEPSFVIGMTRFF